VAELAPPRRRHCNTVKHGEPPRFWLGSVHTIEDRRATDEVGERLQHAEGLAKQHEREDREHEKQRDDERYPDPDHGSSLYLDAPAAAHSATTRRASAGSTTVATPGIDAMSRLRP
jgi:hypothetical protein